MTQQELGRALAALGELAGQGELAAVPEYLGQALAVSVMNTLAWHTTQGSGRAIWCGKCQRLRERKHTCEG